MTAEFTVTSLWKEYIAWVHFKYNGEAPVTERFYRDIFTNHYNIVPRAQKTDTCDVCDALKMDIKLLESQPGDTGSTSGSMVFYFRTVRVV